MKILHINNFHGVDYMNDMVFHGGKTIFGNSYEESTYAWYMYVGAKDYKHRLYGRGFSMSCRLPQSPKTSTDSIVEKIRDNYYDYIIFGSVWRCLQYVEYVAKCYPKNRVAFIDGEDHTGIEKSLLGKGLYFKRELVDNIEGVVPINFCIPKELIVTMPPKKTQLRARNSYGHVGYIFDNEFDYHQEYRRSWFGETMRKGGWDCLRHYEILANYCFPQFLGLENCPPQTMTLFPKKQILSVLHKLDDLAHGNYWDVMLELHEHTKKYLTTDYLIKYIIERLA